MDNLTDLHKNLRDNYMYAHILQIQILRLRDNNKHAQGHTMNKW